MSRTYAAVGQLIAAHRQEAAAALGVQPGEHILDLTRPLTYEIAQRFQIVRTTEYDFGFTFLAIAFKKRK